VANCGKPVGPRQKTVPDLGPALFFLFLYVVLFHVLCSKRHLCFVQPALIVESCTMSSTDPYLSSCNWGGNVTKRVRHTSALVL